jgi:hypothetical protein
MPFQGAKAVKILVANSPPNQGSLKTRSAHIFRLPLPDFL